MRRIELLVVAAALGTVACIGPNPPDIAKPEAGREEQQERDDHAAHRMHEGAITFSRQGQTFKTTVLGGLIGASSSDGVKVSVHVLQAESPERLKPTGTGPTHLFNLTFVDEQTQELIREASGSVTVTGPDGRQRRGAVETFESHFQARVRLDHPGDYLVQVEFETGSGSGVTDPLPFVYRWKDGDTDCLDHDAAGH